MFGAADIAAAAVTTPVDGECGIVDAVVVLWPIVTTPRLAAIEFGVDECWWWWWSPPLSEIEYLTLIYAYVVDYLHLDCCNHL